MTVTVGIRELRENLRSFLDRVKSGEEVVITERGKAVARVVPAGSQATFDRLVREGRIRPALRPKTPAADPRTLPKVRGGTVADLVIEQRGG